MEMCYDSKKGGVDFVLKKLTNNPIPLEVGIGRKDKKQIKTAIKRYDADYGVVISDKTEQILKEDNVLFIPYTTFSLI